MVMKLDEIMGNKSINKYVYKTNGRFDYRNIRLFK